MIAYKKQRRKVDPVKQILARLEEKQSKSGLSLYSRSDLHEPEQADVLPIVQPVNEATSAASKNSSFFPDLSAARRKAHRRLNAGLKHAIDESDRKSALYMQAKADRRLNLTFPPVKSQEMAAPVNHHRQSYTFSGWSDSPSNGVENLRNSHHTNMNPFGYNRRTLAFQPTSVNYVVEWPETWPLKIMSLNKGTGRPRKKKEKAKLTDFRRVQFENSPVPCTSPEREGKSIAKQCITKRAENQPKPGLPEMQTTQSTNTTFSQSSISEKPTHEEQIEELAPKGGDLEEKVTGNLLEVEDKNSAENPRANSDMSSLSENAFVETVESKTSEVPGETENQQTDNIARLSSVPPSTPTPKGVDNLSKDGKDLQEREGGVGEEDSQSLLMEVVSQIAAEPGADYMQDI